MIDQIKLAQYLLGSIVLSCFLGFVYYEGRQAGEAKIQTAWDKQTAQLKANYEAQLAASKLIEDKQNAINTKIQTSYNRDTRILSERLRDLPDTTCTVTMPEAPESSSGTTATAEATTNFRSSDALADTLQCSKLIEWVKENKLD